MIDNPKFYRELEIDVLARTLWGEARGEGIKGMEAVACVVFNRVRCGGWWGRSVIQVCQKPYQFSCWNKNDSNFMKLLAVDDRDRFFRSAQEVARRALAGLITDPTGGATHYHADSIRPRWVGVNKPSAIIGHHIFYNLKE